MSVLSQKPRVPTKATQLCAEQPAAADALQPTLRCGFQARLSRSVGQQAAQSQLGLEDESMPKRPADVSSLASKTIQRLMDGTSVSLLSDTLLLLTELRRTSVSFLAVPINRSLGQMMTPLISTQQSQSYIRTQIDLVSGGSSFRVRAPAPSTGRIWIGIRRLARAFTMLSGRFRGSFTSVFSWFRTTTKDIRLNRWRRWSR